MPRARELRRTLLRLNGSRFLHYANLMAAGVSEGRVEAGRRQALLAG
jgi:hypothetical protein